MPLKWLAAFIAASVLCFASGCSLAAKEWIDASRAQMEESQKEKEVAKKEEEEPSTDEPSPDAPDSTDGAEGPAAGDGAGLLDGKKLEASNITILADDRNWQQVDFQILDTNHEYTEFTPDGQPSDLSRELIGVHFFKGLHHQASVSQTAEVMKRGMEEESQGTVTWKVLSQDRDNMLVELSLTGNPQGNMYGYARFLTTHEGICTVLYLTGDVMSDEEKKKWQSLLNQANRAGVTL
ncbi:hypothetical protein C8P63_10379 [Melghirimyces profundicolus]|uniref:Lipoprotein n=1 Tax=Melghirimyces profundicolus TaxID=1242148 RepID=A0A2T6C7P8_9BACL|nr:hypothetical protein [Melghirimyces profundicolus]PTX64296.1 hypothetical protein C8P63_10379 [Melghirimyces profundicolus]